MTNILGAYRRDANGVPITTHGISTIKTMTFAGGTANDPGDYDGTGNPATLFTVTGDVLVQVFAVCGVDLAGANATVEVGITGNTASFIAQTTGTTIDAGHVWVDATPGTVQPLSSVQIITGGTDIIQTVATANLTAGKLTYYCIWTPLSEDANVV